MKKIFFLICVLSFLPSLFAYSGISFDKISFFEAGYNPPAQGNRTYKNSFSQKDTRYIWCEFQVKNLFYGVREQNLKVKYRYYKPDGSFFGEVPADFIVQLDKETASLAQGWGWETSGQWGLGNYRVDIIVGEERVGHSYFTVSKNEVLDTSHTLSTSESHLEYNYVRLMEGGESVNPGPDTAYGNYFPKSSTRSVYFYVNVKNKLWNIRNQKSNIHGMFYRPDGSFFGRANIAKDIPSTSQNHNLWSGWGWLVPGNWEVGKHRLEVFVDNKKVAEKNFTIFDDTERKESPYFTQFEYTQARFYGADYNEPPVEKRNFTTVFNKNQAKYIWCQINVNNLAYEKEAHTHKVVWRYYKPDGTLHGETSNSFEIKPSWKEAWIGSGWGWSDPGYWATGVYRVDVHIDNRKVSSRHFAVKDDTYTTKETSIIESPSIIEKTPVLSKGSLEYEFVQLFEGGEFAKSGADTAYNEYFPKSSTRSIYFLVGVKNKLWKVRNQKSNIHGMFYRPDGSFFGRANIEKDILSTWENSDLSSGWGWLVPGNWETGQYRVEVFIDNKSVAEKNFTIFDDTEKKDSTYFTNLEYNGVRFYESDENQPSLEKRKFTTTFSKDKTRFIWCQIDAKNLAYERNAHNHKVIWRYYNPDGTLQGETTNSFNIKPEWEKTWVGSGWGWDDAGNWPTGVYRVDVYIDEKKVGSRHFAVGNEK